LIITQSKAYEVLNIAAAQKQLACPPDGSEMHVSLHRLEHGKQKQDSMYQKCVERSRWWCSPCRLEIVMLEDLFTCWSQIQGHWIVVKSTVHVQICETDSSKAACENLNI